jgi:L-threonylcarbamoyladenylate synthase
VNCWQLCLADKILSAGGVIAYPTESVFGLGCRATNLAAVARLLEIKQRPVAKGLILLVSDIRQAQPWLSALSVEQVERINQPLQRATTWLIDKHPDVSRLIVGDHHKLAVRVTSHPIAKRLCELGTVPIISTSCNRNSKPAYQKIARVRNKMRLNVDHIVSGRCQGQAPSAIVDLESGRIYR